jgi:DNA-binding response OmpR family regulator
LFVPDTILVATSDAAFGELLRTGLMESGKYSVALVSSGSEVLSLVASCACDLAILDAELPDEPFVPLVQALMSACPGMKVMIVPPDNNLRHARLTGLSPHGYILSPFFLPDLLAGVETVLAAGDAPAGEPLLVQTGLGAEGLNWAENPLRAGQVLARLLLQTDATAVMIAFEGKLWAFAGQIPDGAAHEIAVGLGKWWQDGLKLDLARYVRLRSTGGEHLVFSSVLLDQLVLALVYSGNGSITRARAQSAQVVEELSRLAAANEPSADPGLELDGDEDASFDVNLAALLAGMPSPDPEDDESLAGLEWVHEDDLGGDDAVAFPWETPAREDAPALDWRSLLDAQESAPQERSFTCVLLPRKPEQHLTGPLAEQVSLWIPQCCMAFGWRLAGLSMRPGYVQFRVVTGPDGSSGNVVSVVRQRTSDRIFNRFPHYRPPEGGDFWAPGCLETEGNGSIPVESLREFITQTRLKQGYLTSQNDTME